jgi:hypothetical protein
MYCDEALNAVEAIAEGDITPDGRLVEHYATCPNCAAALDSARALERMLQHRPLPRPPAQFTARTMTRVRRARWRTDQFLDLGFNVALGIIVLGVLVAGWILLNRTGFAAVSNEAVDVFARGFVTFVQQIGPSIPLYAGAMALLATALGIWWWAERDAV